MIAEVTIKEYLDIRFAGLTIYCDTRFDAMEKAAIRQIVVTDGRLDKLNEVREQLEAQYSEFHIAMGKYLPRLEYEARHETLEVEIRAISEWKANITGRMWAIGILLAMMQISVEILKHFYFSK